MDREYKIVGETKNGMLIVIINRNAHIMSRKELNAWCGKFCYWNKNKAA